MEPSESNGNFVGASVRRKEDFRLVQGEGRYTGDIMPRDAAVMLVLRSPHAHARIRAVDARAARDNSPASSPWSPAPSSTPPAPPSSPSPGSRST